MNFWFLGQKRRCKLCLKCLSFRQNLVRVRIRAGGGKFVKNKIFFS